MPGLASRCVARSARSEPERAEIVRVLRRLPAVVAEWSEGNAGFDELRIDVLDRPLRRLSMTSPGRWWVGPDDVGELLAERAPRGRWDSVFLVYPTDGSFTPCGWACTRGPTPVAGGAGFSSITSDRWEPDQHRLFPEEGFVHEWLHQVEGMYRPVGLGHSELPDLHDVADRTSARSTEVSPYGYATSTTSARRTWQPWYRDLRTGTGREKDGERPPLGLTPERWARRRH